MIPNEDLPDGWLGPSSGTFRPPILELPNDSDLPALAAIREEGLADVLPELGLPQGPVDVRLRGYTPGSRATFEARVDDRRFAIKVYAHDPKPEAQLYMAFGKGGLAGDSGPRVSKLLHWARDLRILVLSWLDGLPTNELIRTGRGTRAGELAALWLRQLASRRVRLGPPFGPRELLNRLGRSVGRLESAAHALGIVSERAGIALRADPPEDRPRRLVHGTLYARHVLDLGDAPGVIDWQRFGQGPVEVDAGMFLATLSRHALRQAPSAEEARRAEQSFVEATRGLVDEQALAWCRSEALLHLASRGLRRDAPAEAGPLVDEAARWAEVASQVRGSGERRGGRRSGRFWLHLGHRIFISFLGLGYVGLWTCVSVGAQLWDYFGIGS